MEKELKKTTPRFDKFILGIGLIVGILGVFITFISNTEIYQPLRFFSIIIYLYIGTEIKIINSNIFLCILEV